MASISSSILFSLTIMTLFLLGTRVSVQLSTEYFYNVSCPNALSIIQTEVNKAVANEPRMGASLIRLFFHDCFVDASPLINSSNQLQFSLKILYFYLYIYIYTQIISCVSFAYALVVLNFYIYFCYKLMVLFITIIYIYNHMHVIIIWLSCVSLSHISNCSMIMSRAAMRPYCWMTISIPLMDWS